MVKSKSLETVTVARVAELARSGFKPVLTNKVDYNPGRQLPSAHALCLDVHMRTYICIQKINKYGRREVQWLSMLATKPDTGV